MRSPLVAIICLLAGFTASGQVRVSVTTDTNGNLLAPINFFQHNAKYLTNMINSALASANTNSVWPVAGNNTTTSTNGNSVTVSADVSHLEVAGASNVVSSNSLSWLALSNAAYIARFYTNHSPSITLGSNSTLVGGSNTVELVNGANSQRMNIYMASNSATDYRRASVQFIGNSLYIGSDNGVDYAGGGDTFLEASGSHHIGFRTSGTNWWNVEFNGTLDGIGSLAVGGASSFAQAASFSKSAFFQGGLWVTNRFGPQCITNAGSIWYWTNDTPQLSLPDGSMATGDGNIYTRTNGAWVALGSGGGGGGGSGTVTSVNVAEQGYGSSGAVNTSGTVTITQNADKNHLGFSETNINKLAATNSAIVGGLFIDPTNVLQVNTLHGAKDFQLGTNGNAYFGRDATFGGGISFLANNSTAGTGWSIYTNTFDTGEGIVPALDITNTLSGSGAIVNTRGDFAADTIIARSGLAVVASATFGGNATISGDVTSSGTVSGTSVKVTSATASTLPLFDSGKNFVSLANPSSAGTWMLTSDGSGTKTWVLSVSGSALQTNAVVWSDGGTNLVNTNRGWAITVRTANDSLWLTNVTTHKAVTIDTNGVIHGDGSGLTGVGGGGGSSYVVSNITVSSVAPVLIDFAQGFNVFKVLEQTNSTLILTNTASLLSDVKLYIKQDSTGGHSTVLTNQDGLTQTNVIFSPTTNANASDIYTLQPGYFTTNVAVVTHKNFQPAVAGGGGGGGGGTSYANNGGSGDRQSIITIGGTAISGVAEQLVDGLENNASPPFLTGGAADGSTITVTFNSGSSAYFDEFTFVQTSTGSQGVWKWQECDDGSTWSDVGSSFTLTGSAAGTVNTEPAGASTPHRYWQMIKVSGSTDPGPNSQELKFKISTGL